MRPSARRVDEVRQREVVRTGYPRFQIARNLVGDRARCRHGSTLNLACDLEFLVEKLSKSLPDTKIGGGKGLFAEAAALGI